MVCPPRFAIERLCVLPGKQGSRSLAQAAAKPACRLRSVALAFIAGGIRTIGAAADVTTPPTSVPRTVAASRRKPTGARHRSLPICGFTTLSERIDPEVSGLPERTLRRTD